MKIIRPSVHTFIITTLCATSILTCAAQEFSNNEVAAVILATKLIEGDSAVANKKLNIVCAELADLMKETKWTDLRTLIEEYARLDVASLSFVGRTKKLKEIVDRLIDLKNRKKLPQDIVDAVERVNKAMLLKRLSSMLAA